MKVEIELPEIEGYEYTGEFRKPKLGEHFVNIAGIPVEGPSAARGPRLILSKSRWRANVGENYYSVVMKYGVMGFAKHTETGADSCCLRFSNSNYFQTPEEAEVAAKKMKSILEGGRGSNK